MLAETPGTIVPTIYYSVRVDPNGYNVKSNTTEDCQAAQYIQMLL